MQRTLAFVFAVAVSLVAPRAHALFHAAHIAEVNAQGGGSASLQYVEIEMLLGSQTFVTNSILGTFDCDGDFLGEQLLVPSNVTNGGAGVRWIMATTTPLGGIAPDFPTATAGIPTDCGQVCWGAPGVSVPPPASWNHTVPGNYVDCVAYGPYTGATHPASGTPTPLPPGDGTFALTRIATTANNANDFALRCPTPQNNAGNVGSFGACTNPTTTTSSSTSTSSSTTTSTSSSTSTSTSTSSSTTSSVPTSTSSTTSSSTSTSSMPATTITTTSSSTSTSTSSSSTTSTSVPTTTSSSVPGTTTSSSSSSSTTVSTSTSTSSSTVVSTSTSTSSSTVASTSTTTSSSTSSSSSTTTVVTTSSTSVTATSSSTTTTVPGATADLLPGKFLELRVKDGKPEKSVLHMVSTKADGLTLGRGPGSPDDPTVAGGRLVVASSSAAGAFTTTYPLDAGTGTWIAKRKKGAITGYTWKGDGPIKKVGILVAKSLSIKGKGPGLGHDLEDDPNPVTVVLQIGEHSYCLAFGGEAKFKPDKRFASKDAPAPVACAPIP